MESPAKSSRAKNAIARCLFLGLFLILTRFIYVVTIHGEKCDSGDFCFFSSPEAVAIPGAAGVDGAKAFARGGSEVDPVRSTKEWRKSVAFYSSKFQGLISDGYLSPTSKALCLGSPVGHEAFALMEIGVLYAVGIAKIKSAPMIVGEDRLRQPFGNDTFDFVFVRPIDKAKTPSMLADELTRILKPGGYLVVDTSSAGDLYSLNSLVELFLNCKLVRSREITGLDSPIIHEVIVQKDELDDASSVGELKVNCSAAKHKFALVNSAEPLIEEEPLKPWIAFKKNLNNVKYLPTIADISFKRKYMYIDVGARSYGSSIGSWFKKQYPKQNRTFEIYAIEADRAFHGEYSVKKGVKLLPYAAWIRNESLSFEVSEEKGEQMSDGRSRGMGRIGQAAATNGSTFGGVNIIQGFDFAEWLRSIVTGRDFVVMKMDVEGTEFDLIRRLFETGATCLIDELFLECHYNRWQRCCPGERSPKYQKTYGQCLELFSSLRESGVLVHQWW